MRWPFRKKKSEWREFPTIAHREYGDYTIVIELIRDNGWRWGCNHRKHSFLNIHGMDFCEFLVSLQQAKAQSILAIDGMLATAKEAEDGPTDDRKRWKVKSGVIVQIEWPRVGGELDVTGF